MKVIKRDGRIVDYDKSKIEIAIKKANREVIDEEKASTEDIKTIISYIERLNKKRILVEDVQDIIEQKLMEIGRYELAKRYIVYRYNRALVRKSNTTDESILGLIRNSNKNINEANGEKTEMTAAMQRDLIAGKVSRDLTKRILLPEKVTSAWENGILYFHNSDYFVQPIINSSIINIKDMLQNGTKLNGNNIESPKGFGVACNIITQIILSVACNQYGEQLVDLECLGEFLNRSKLKFIKEIKEELGEEIEDKTLEKLVKKRIQVELSAGVQTLEYQINTLIKINGKKPQVTLVLNLDEKSKYIEENAMIIEKILRQRQNGVINKTPKLVYITNNLNGLGNTKYWYLTELAGQVEDVEIINNKKFTEYKLKRGMFNQGLVTINLPQIGIMSEGKEELFWNLLEERLEICKEALMCRHYALLGTNAQISPIHWKNGAIARLESGEKIDKFLYNGYSSISLGYIGLYETSKLMSESNEKEFAEKIKKSLKEFTERCKKETNICFIVCDLEERNNQEESAAHIFVQIDKEKFGTIKGITDKECYTNTWG